MSLQTTPLINAVPVTVAQGGTGAATHTANNVLVGAGSSAITSVAPGSSGNVLTSNGTTWASSAPAAGSSEITLISTFFETAGRFTATNVGTGGHTFNTAGLNQSTGTTNPSSAKLTAGTMGGYSFTDGLRFTAVMDLDGNVATNQNRFAGVGDVTVAGAGITYTAANQFGFKTRNTGGASEYYVTNANATTETETATGYDAGSVFLFHAYQTSTTNIKFYSNKTLEATHTTNLPTGAPSFLICLGTSNVSSASDFDTNFQAVSVGFLVA